MNMGSVCSEIPELPEIVEGVVCKSEHIQDGKMAEIEMDGHKILLLREQGELKALGAYCTHYGAPLIKGAFDGGGTVRCPWHGACFNSDTGDIEDFPGLDSLACHKVEEKDGNVIVTADKRELITGRRHIKISEIIEESEERIVIIGAGAAGQSAAETLRKEGFTGKITMLTAENNIPYDRPKLSKNLSVKHESIVLRKPGWYDKAKIEVRKGVKVVGIDANNKEVQLDNGTSLVYYKLLICTGAVPRTLGVSGELFNGVSYLRTINDANQIHRDSVRKHVVVIGTSFIGMEVAASLIETAASVTVIGRDSVPFLSSLGEEVGRYIMAMHQQKGVQFCMEEEIAEFCGNSEGNLVGVLLKSDRRLKADLVVIGIGVSPATDIEGITKDQRGYVEVDSKMATTLPDVWAAGDIVKFPLNTYKDSLVKIGHWGLAMYHGKVAALNMLSIDVNLNTVPFFWTVQFGKSLRYAGYGGGWNSVMVEILEEEEKILAVYCKEEEVCAVATLGRDPIAAKFANFVKSGNVLRKEDAFEWCKNQL